MSVEVIAKKRTEAAHALRKAEGWRIIADVVEGFRGDGSIDEVTEAIRLVGVYVTDPTEDAADRAALHALALLLAAMTEPT